MTYREIAETFQELYGISCKPCWIAHMKALLGLIPDREARAYPSNQIPGKNCTAHSLGR
jgi:hypothetical protein